MKIIRTGDGSRVLQQRQWRNLAGPTGFHHGFVFGGILIGPEQNFVQLVLDGRRAFTPDQVLRPKFNLRQDLFFLFNACQSQLNCFGRGFLTPPLACAAKIMRRLIQPHESTHLLGGAGVGIEIFAGDVGKAKLGVGRKFPSQIKLNALANERGFRQKLGRRRFVKFQKYVGTFDFDALAAVQFHLN